MYKVVHFSEVEEDLYELPDEVLNEVFEYFEKYKIDPLKYSSKLYNQGNLNLKGYRKTYVAQASYRIVIHIENNITKVVEVVAVGKRNNKEVYKTAHDRLHHGRADEIHRLQVKKY
ncbi:MAG: hypothetical protein DRG24_00250 [Epsilonproteobacteria bacterium]|nr:MAG: hypothetical protein DRG24_00250 [Campylobacterota bacterium]